MKLPKILLGIFAFGGSLFLPALAYSQNTTTAIFENSLAEPWQNWSWGAKVDLNASHACHWWAEYALGLAERAQH